MSYKHLVLSGGSWKGLYMAGAIDKLIDREIINFDIIERFEKIKGKNYYWAFNNTNGCKYKCFY